MFAVYANFCSFVITLGLEQVAPIIGGEFLIHESAFLLAQFPHVSHIRFGDIYSLPNVLLNSTMSTPIGIILVDCTISPLANFITTRPRSFWHMALFTSFVNSFLASEISITTSSSLMILASVIKNTDIGLYCRNSLMLSPLIVALFKLFVL